MDNDLIKALIEALEASSLSELEYSRDGVSLRLVKGCEPLRAAVPRPARARAAPEPAVSAVTSPQYGVVYLRRSPGAPPLVAVGQAVAAGQVLCLIEAMKVFTELRAEQDGTIAAVLVETGQDVEAGQALFRLE